MRNLILSSCYLIVGILLPVFSQAQTQNPDFDRIEQMMRRMQEQMLRGMPFDSAFGGSQFQISPDSNSFFYFHSDTSFNGTGSDFFNLSPGLQGFDQLIEQFFGADPFAPRRGQSEFPADDGQSSDEDGLLPEERLRLQEEKAKTGEQPEKAPKPKVKTIRI